jgi:hypothetical protein
MQRLSFEDITTTEPIVPSQPLRRVVSLIASATEIVSALGRNDWLVGRSHECDFPPEVARLPALTAPKFKVEGTSAEIDARVQQIVRDGLSVYRVDGDALKALAPRHHRHAGSLRSVRGEPRRCRGRHLHLDRTRGRHRLA